MTDVLAKTFRKTIYRIFLKGVNACAREDELERRLLHVFGELSQIVADRNSIFIVMKQATLVFLLNFTKTFDQLQEQLPIEQS